MPNDQAKDIAARARLHAGMSSSPMGEGEDVPSSFVEHVQNRMKQQGEEQARKTGYEKTAGGERIKGSYKTGGTVPETGVYRLHRGETVIPSEQYGTGEEMTRVPMDYRNVVAPGKIGSVEGRDPMLPAPQRVETIAHAATETRPQELHRSETAPLRSYATFEPRRAPMPRAAQDEGFLEGPANLSADPLMTGENSNDIFCHRDARRKDLYGENIDGMAHNSGHPGFAAVQNKIEQEGYSKESAGAILASKTRSASKAAHKANPRLNKVRG